MGQPTEGPRGNHTVTNHTALTAALLIQGRDAELRGEQRQAIAFYEQVISATPNEPVAWTRLGILHSTAGAAERALAAFEVAASLIPQSAAAAYNFGRALTVVQRPIDAIPQFKRALALRPLYPEAYLALLAALPETTPAAEHLELCERAERDGCQHAHLSQHYGLKLQAIGRHQEAMEQFTRAKASDPTLISAEFARGNSLHALGQHAEAIAVFDTILSTHHDYHDVRVNRGISEAALGRVHDALNTYTAVLNVAPDHAIAHRASGFSLLALRQFEEAIQHLQKAIELSPEDTDAWEALGDAYAATNFNLNAQECFRFLSELLDKKQAPSDLRIRALNRQLDQAITVADFSASRQCCARLEALERDSPYVLGRHVLATLFQADWAVFSEQRPRLLDAASTQKPTCSPFTLLAVADDPMLQKNYASHYISWGFPEATRVPAPATRHAPTRLRVGYVSPDFRDHPVGQLVAPLFENHDRERFHISAFSLWSSTSAPAEESATTQRLRAGCDHFVDLSRLDDASAAALIREHHIDILVDLAGHTSGARTGIFSLRPAPIQVNYLGYPGTLGASFYDYLIGDPHVTPTSHAAYYAEEIICLPRSYLPPGDRRSPPSAPESRECYGLPKDALVLGAFHTTYKIMPDLFHLWLRLLVAWPHAVLWLNPYDQIARTAMIEEAGKVGVAASRLVFAERVPNLAAHLSRLQAADLLLDTFPYGSHSAAIDALWAGTPILTCCGDSFASRVCAGLLIECGLPELVATSLSDYERIAHTLLANPLQLSALKSRLAQQRGNPLFDAKEHVASLEAAYEQMWAKKKQA